MIDAQWQKNKSVLIAFLFITVCIVYSRALWCDFTNYDDPFFVTLNDNVRAGISLKNVYWAFTAFPEGNWIPLSWLSHMFDVQLFGLNPAGHHLTNVLLHAAATVLLFQFLFSTTAARWESATVALLFGVHPLHVESVTWVAERKDVLSAFFWMLTMVTYAEYVRMQTRSRYMLCLLSFLGGLLAKPMLVTMPFVMLLLDFWPLKRVELRDHGNHCFAKCIKLLIEKVPFVLLSAAASILTFVAQKSGGNVYESFTLYARFAKSLTYYVTYLWKLLLPVNLSVFYPMSLFSPPIWMVVLAGLFLTVVTAASLFFIKKHPYLFAGWMWYLVTLLPVIGLVQVGQHSIADRYTYIPSVGISILAVWGVTGLARKVCCPQRFLSGVTIAVLVVFSILTFIQLGYWKNSITLFSHAAVVTYRNHVAYNNLGQALLEVGRFDEAIENFRRSIEVFPVNPIAMVNLGDAFLRKGDYGQALDEYARILMIDQNNSHARYGLGRAYLFVGRRDFAWEQYSILKDYSPILAQSLLEAISTFDSGKLPETR